MIRSEGNERTSNGRCVHQLPGPSRRGGDQLWNRLRRGGLIADDARRGQAHDDS